jgi:hypothetical protein
MLVLTALHYVPNVILMSYKYVYICVLKIACRCVKPIVFEFEFEFKYISPYYITVAL